MKTPRGKNLPSRPHIYLYTKPLLTAQQAVVPRVAIPRQAETETSRQRTNQPPTSLTSLAPRSTRNPVYHPHPPPFQITKTPPTNTSTYSTPPLPPPRLRARLVSTQRTHHLRSRANRRIQYPRARGRTSHDRTRQSRGRGGGPSNTSASRGAGLEVPLGVRPLRLLGPALAAG